MCTHASIRLPENNTVDLDDISQTVYKYDEGGLSDDFENT